MAYSGMADERAAERAARPWVSVLLFCFGSLSACGAEGNKTPKSAEPARATSLGERPYWVFHPLTKEAGTFRLLLEGTGPGGTELEVDEAGGRWLHAPGKPPEPSAYGAPEALVAASQQGNRFAFVGQSGTVYFAPGPLLEFDEVRAPEESFRLTRPVGDSLLGVGQEGELFRSEDLGKSWSLASKSEFFVSVADAGNGEVLALSVPEQWHRSTDAGKSFEVLPGAPLCPSQIVSERAGGVMIDGLLSSHRYKSGSFTQVSGDFPESQAAEDREHYELPRYGRASLVLRHRAELQGESFVSLSPSEGKKPWTLSKGTLGKPLSEVSVQGLSECRRAVLAAAKDRTLVLCETSRGQEVAPQLRLLALDEKQTKFVPLSQKGKTPAPPLRGDADQMRLALSSQGSLALTGLCPLEETSLGCSPSGLVRVNSEGKFTQVSMPGLPVPDVVSFGARGQLWAAGFRAKDGHLLVVLDEEGTDLAPKMIDLTRLAGFPQVGPLESRGDALRLAQPGIFLLPGEGDLMSVVERVAGRFHIALLDGKGALLSSAEAPLGVTALHGAGARLLGIAPEAGTVFESSTAGLAWTRESLPRNVCQRGETRCEVALVCSESGCLVGDELSKVGWGGTPGAASEAPLLGNNRTKVAWRSPPIDCQVTGSDWEALPGLLAIPEARDAALGQTAWAQVQSFPSSASATSVHVPFGASKIERTRLLSPVADPESYSFFVVPQVEGSVALRYPIKSQALLRSAGSASGSQMMDVAWDNRVAGIVRQGSFVPDAAQFRTFSGSSAWLHGGRPDLVSVAGNGVYIRLGQESAGSPTYFLSGTASSLKVEQLPPLDLMPQPQSAGGWLHRSNLLASLQRERIQVHGEHAALFLMARSRVVVEVIPESGELGWRRYPYLLGSIVDDAAQVSTELTFEDVSLAYQGEDVGFISVRAPADSAMGEARFVRLAKGGGFDPPVSVPLQASLRGTVIPCSERERRETPRVIAPPLGQISRSVLVSGAGAAPVNLETGSAVLFGTVESPCVAAFDAQPASALDRDAVRHDALLVPGEGNTSWLFRRTQNAAGGVDVEARALSCAFPSN